MTEHDDLIREAREVIAARATLGGMPDDSLIEALADALEAAQRPPVSPEVRDAVQAELDRHEYAGNNMCECGESWGGTSDGVVWTAEANGHITAALLARFSLPSQPVYDEEKILRVLVEAARGPISDGEWAISRTETHSAARVYAAALVAALRGGELTVEETNE